MSVNLTIHRGVKKDFTVEVTRGGVVWSGLEDYSSLECRIADTLSTAADYTVVVTVEDDYDLFFTVTEAISTLLTADKYYYQIIGYEESDSDPEQIEYGILYVLPSIT